MSRSLICRLTLLSSSFSFINTQSIPGASFFSGNGIPNAGQYQLIDDYEPSVFFNKFNFYSSYDPTYGHVQYVNQAVATQNGYVSTTSQGTARIGVDTTNNWPRGGPGRPSVRIISDNTYTHGLFIFDAVHMPTGCGSWPAYWLLGPSWPSNGEIDIIEGVNTLTQDSISLHSSPGCTVAGSGQTGTLQTTNCDSNANGNSGCGSTLNSTTIPNNYGVPFNNNGGGVYATEWTSSYFKTWFFPRGSIPSSITNGKPDVSTFGTPAVNHQGSCNIDQHFNNMSIIINIDFCGAWAGQVYSQYTDCPQNTSTNSLNSCVDFVGNNPSYFTRAYWEINSLKVYQMPAGAVPSSSYTTSLSSASPTASTNTINLGNGQSTSVSSAQYTGPLTSVTTSAAQASSTPIICPTYNNTAYTNFNKQSYTIGCGLDHNGAGANLPGNGVYSANSLENCLEICDNTSGCVAVAYVGGNFAGTCYAKSTQGTFVYSGAVNAAIRAAANTSSIASISASATAPVNAGPTCPGSAGSTYTDSNNVAYSIVCSTDFSSNNIGSPSSYTSLSACLPACDAMTGCAGAIFNSALNLCQLKSSFSGSQNNNQSVIAARRNVVATSSSRSSSKSSSSAVQNGYGGNPGYGGYGYSIPPMSDDYGYGYEPATSSALSSSSSSARLSSASSSRSSMATSSTSPVSSTSSSSPSSTPVSSTAPSTSSSIAGSTSLPNTSSSSLLPSSSSSIGSSTSATSSSSSTPTKIDSSSSASSSSILSSSPLSGSSSSSYFSSSSSSKSSSSSVSQYFPSIPTPSSASSPSSSISSAQSSSTSVSALASGSTSYLLFSSTVTSTSQSTSSIVGSSISSMTSMVLSTTIQSSPSISKITSASPCPSSASGYCSQPSGQQTICSDNTGAIYAVTCGTVYDGNIIDTSGIYGRAVELIVRATEPNVAACQNLCDRISGCVAFNYIGTNCVLLSSISQTYNQPNAIGASLIASAVSASSTIPMSSIAQYFSSPASSPTPTPSSGLSTAASITSNTIPASTSAASTNVVVTATQSGNTVTLTTTTTTQAPPGGYYTTNSNGSYYVYSSTPSNSASLCYTCVLTPTVITTGDPGSNTQLPTCSTRTGTITIFTTSTLTTCPPQPTCPASGYVLIGASQSRPGQQIVTTTDPNGNAVTYTQVPTSSMPGPGDSGGNGSGGNGSGGNGPGGNGSGGNGPGGNGSGGNGSGGNGGSPTSGTSPGNTNTPTCPQSDGTRFTDSMGMVYEIQCGIVYTDATLDTQTQNTITGCITSCDMYNTKTFYTAAQCLGISWFPKLSTNNCLLKAGSTPLSQKNCDSCQLLTPGNHINNNNTNSYSNGPGGYGSMSGGSTFTTVVGGSTQVSTYTTTASASTVTQYSTIVSNGQTTANIVGYSTVPESTIVGTTTNVVGGSTIVTQGGGPGYYGGGGGNGGNAGTTIVTGGGGGSIPSTVYAVSTAVSTYVSNGQTILSTYGVTTAQSVVYLPATTKTVTTTSVSVSISLQVTSILTTIITTVSQGYTTTIVTYIPETITPSGYGGGGYGGNGGNGGTVTVTQSAGPGTTVYVTETVTMTVLPSSTSSSFTCRTYATNYLNGLHGRAEPTSSPKQGNGMILTPVLSPPTRQRKGSIFEKDVVLAQIANMPKVAPSILAHEFELWFVE